MCAVDLLNNLLGNKMMLGDFCLYPLREPVHIRVQRHEELGFLSETLRVTFSLYLSLFQTHSVDI